MTQEEKVQLTRMLDAIMINFPGGYRQSLFQFADAKEKFLNAGAMRIVKDESNAKQKL